MTGPEGRFETRRSAYRVDADRLEVILTTPAGERWAGRLNHLSIRGGALEFDRLRAPSVRLGTGVLLTVRSDRLDEPVALPAVVRSRTDAPDSCIYGVEFDWLPELEEKLAAGRLYPLFNRRRARRVVPDPSRPIRLSLRGSGGVRIEPTLKDLSRLGLGAVIIAADGHRLGRSSNVDVNLRLPHLRRAVGLYGTIRYRWGSDSEIRCGIEFERDDRFYAAEDVISSYVRERCGGPAA